MFCIRLKSHVQPTNLIPIQVKAFRIIDQHCANDLDKYWVCSTCFYQYITFHLDKNTVQKVSKLLDDSHESSAAKLICGVAEVVQRGT